MCAGAGDARNFFWHSRSSSSSCLSSVFSSSISERVRTLCFFLSSSLSIIWKGLGTVTLELGRILAPVWSDTLACGFGREVLGWNRNRFWLVILSGLSSTSLRGKYRRIKCDGEICSSVICWFNQWTCVDVAWWGYKWEHKYLRSLRSDQIAQTISNAWLSPYVNLLWLWLF